MKKLCSIILLSLFVLIRIQAQNKIIILSDHRIDTLIQRSIEKHEKDKGIPGYRIQIYSGTNRQLAIQLKSQFLQTYPEYRAYMVYAQPYFKIKVGDFRSRMEALPLLSLLKQDERFKAVLMVPDRIEIPELKY